MHYKTILLVTTIILFSFSQIHKPTFYFLSNVLLGIGWAIIFFLYDQLLIIPSKELPKPSLKHFFITPDIVHKTQNRKFSLYTSTGASIFFIVYLTGDFWGYELGKINELPNAILLASLIGIVYSGFFGSISIIEYFLELRGCIKWFLISYIIFLTSFLAFIATGLSFSTTPFFIVSCGVRIGLSLAKLHFDADVITKNSTIILQYLFELVVVILFIFFLI